MISTLPSLLDDSNYWSLISEIISGHSIIDLGGLEESNCSRCFPLTMDSIQLLSITSRLGGKIVCMPVINADHQA